MQPDSNRLVAYVMTHNQMSQQQAMDWLDKWVSEWRTEPPPQVVGTIFYDAALNGYENE